MCKRWPRVTSLHLTLSAMEWGHCQKLDWWEGKQIPLNWIIFYFFIFLLGDSGPKKGSNISNKDERHLSFFWWILFVEDPKLQITLGNSRNRFSMHLRPPCFGLSGIRGGHKTHRKDVFSPFMGSWSKATRGIWVGEWILLSTLKWR